VIFRAAEFDSSGFWSILFPSENGRELLREINNLLNYIKI